MTVTARKVLGDLEVATRLLRQELTSDQLRVLWVAGVALCRAIGHALAQVDSKSSPELKLAISNRFALWEADRETHRIFFEFIKGERDAVLKEYEFGFLAGAEALGNISIPEDMKQVLPDNFFCPISEGCFAGVDARDVLDTSARWWRRQLDEIDSA